MDLPPSNPVRSYDSDCSDISHDVSNKLTKGERLNRSIHVSGRLVIHNKLTIAVLQRGKPNPEIPGAASNYGHFPRPACPNSDSSPVKMELLSFRKRRGATAEPCSNSFRGRNMCNRFNIKSDPSEIAYYYSADLSEESDWENWDSEADIFPNGISPAILASDNRTRQLIPMKFGLVPVGAIAPDPKRLLNNARVEKLDGWPWKLSAPSYRCVVPVSEFREPLYWGTDAGTEANFYSPESQFLTVAALYSLWNNPSDHSEVATMTFLMRPAGEYVMAHGHQRQPFFLSEQGIDDWIDPAKHSIEHCKDILREFAVEPPLAHRVERQMATSWTKRKSGKLKNRDAEIAAINELGPLGI